MEIVSHSDRRVKFESSTHERTSAVRGADDAFDAEALDTALPELREGALRWAATSPGERAFLFERVIADTHAVGLDWDAAACRANGLDPDGPDSGCSTLSVSASPATPIRCAIATATDCRCG
jgi:hypothetical protein